MLATALSAVAGAALGLVYFRGLQATVERLQAARRPGALLLASMLARMALALAVFYVVATHADWQALVAALAGFVVVRTWLLHRARTGARAP